jgi:tetratricopeptide (TPR) repeat protein
MANALGRRERDMARVEFPPQETQGARQQPAASQNQSSESDSGAPTEAEIRDAIARADERAADTNLQLNFGTALYRYASDSGQAQYLPDIARMLKRAYDANPQDHDLTLLLANVLFDIGQTTDRTRFREARTLYTKALQMKSDDVNARTDLGLSYYLDDPSDPARAVAEYRKSLAINPRHEQTLQNLATALISMHKLDEAQQRIDELANINPQNPALPNLRAQLAQARNGAP